MSEENFKIADIIFAYIKGTITESELEELTEWMNAAEDHRKLFQQIITSESYRDKDAVYRRFDSYYDFDRLWGTIRTRKRSMWKYVAAAAVTGHVFITNETRGDFFGEDCFATG